MGKPLFAKKLSGEEGRKLRSISLSKDFTKRTRASVVLESSNGLGVSEIADKLHLNKHTVRLWIKRFNESGPEGLESRSPSGRPPSITNEQKDKIVRIALTNPRRLGMSFTTWSLSTLRSYLEGKSVVKRISQSWIRKILAKKGLSTSGARGGRLATIPITMPR